MAAGDKFIVVTDGDALGSVYWHAFKAGDIVFEVHDEYGSVTYSKSGAFYGDQFLRPADITPAAADVMPLRTDVDRLRFVMRALASHGMLRQGADLATMAEAELRAIIDERMDAIADHG